MGLGDGNPQFSVITRLDGKQIGLQEIHDPIRVPMTNTHAYRCRWDNTTTIDGVSIRTRKMAGERL